MAGLRYGAVAINIWSAAAFVFGATTWGAFPGHTPADIGSGVGAVHNARLVDRPQKTVLRAPVPSVPQAPVVRHPSLRRPGAVPGGGARSRPALVAGARHRLVGGPGLRRAGRREPASVKGDPRAGRIRRDAAALARADETLARAAAVAGRFEVPLRPPGFATLTWLILGQQVSIEAADAMFGRLEATLGEVTPGGLLGLDDETLRRCGFSRQKAGYARDLARALLAGDFSLEEVEALPDAAAVAALTGRRGIGVWTAENYLIWGLGRRDVFPAATWRCAWGGRAWRGRARCRRRRPCAGWQRPGRPGGPQRPSSSGTTTSRPAGGAEAR